VLAKKAKDEEETAQTAAARARNKVIELQQSRQRMDALLQDYKQRALESQARLQTMSQTTNSRQFLLQLQSLVSRVDDDLRNALRELEQAKAVLLQATHQRMKMETMQEKDLQAVQTWERKRDQKEMDSLGLTLYNLKA
jgi:flagellar export protein FliJ